MVLAMAAFAAEDALFKATTSSYPPGLSLIVFGTMGLGLFAALSLWRGERIWHPAILSRPLLLRSAAEIGGRLFFALALALTPLASTSAILQATPLAVTLGAALIFGERVGWRRWVAVAVGFAGVLVVLRPGLDAFQPASVFAVLGMLGFAARDLATRASPAAMSMPQLGSLGFAMLVLAGGILALAGGEGPVLPDGAGLLRLTGAALFGTLAYGALTLAVRSGELSFVSPFRYARLIFAVILAVLIFGERPDAMTLLGGAVIVGSGIYSVLRERRLRLAAAHRSR